MGEKTAISWCDHTWNPWIGCQKVSPACDGCYAENLMDTRMGRVEWGGPGKGVGTRARTSASTWRQPIKWQKDYLARLSAWDHGIRALFDGDERRAIFEGWSKPARPFVFCASLADIFDNQVEPTWRRDAFSVMRETPHLVYLLLTKRPGNIVNLAEEAGGLPPNAALGTTVEDPERAINLFRLAVAARTARMARTTAASSMWGGGGDWTRMPWTAGSALRSATTARRSS
jgi:protein gp37